MNINSLDAGDARRPQIVKTYENLAELLSRDPGLKKAGDGIILNSTIDRTSKNKGMPLGDVILTGPDNSVIQYSCEEKSDTGQKIVSQTVVGKDGNAYRTCVDANSGTIISGIKNRAVGPEDPELPMLRAYIKGKSQNPTHLSQM